MYNSYNYNKPASIDAPDEASLLGLVQHLNKDELQALLDNETKVLEMVCDNTQIKQMVTQKETVEASIKSLADYNTKQKPRFEELKATLTSLHTQLNEVRCRYDLSRARLDSMGNTSPDEILVLLQASVAEVEEQSENTATAFLRGDINCDSFLDQFRRERKLAHQRRIRAEKMAELAVSHPHNSISAPITASVASVVTSAPSVPLSGPPPLPPREFAAHPPYAPTSTSSTAPPPLPSRPPGGVGSYWNQASMPMPQPYGAGATGMYGAAGGGYNAYFNQRM